MSTTGTQSSTRPAIFPVEWPLARITAGNTRQPPVCRETTPKIKRRRIEYRSIIERNEPWPQAPRTAAECRTQTEDKPQDSDLGTTVEYQARGTTTRDVKYEPALPTAIPNIFQSLDHDEASWLVEEVNEANRSIIGAERTAERLRKEGEELDRKKASLSALKSLLNDLRRNIKYPDEEIAKDLDTLDEVSGNFGVRNMVNCLGLLDNYFSDLQKQLDK